MKFRRSLFFGSILMVLGLASQAAAPGINSIQDFNQTLPTWGFGWAPGEKSINGYYPSFYTGFAMRSEFPDRIHVRISRGNQTRVTVILDDQTIRDYLFDLSTRASFYKKMTSGGPMDLNPRGSSIKPQLAAFNQILASPTYGILDFVQSAKSGGQSDEAIYAKSLAVLKALNPGRVFQLHLDLKNEFNKWKTQMQAMSGGDASKITGNPAAVIGAINSLVFGRINLTEKPSDDVMGKLNVALAAALINSPDSEFIPAAAELFKAATGTKYEFQVVNANGQWESPLQCSADSCFLNYPEFTAIYPTGSVMDATHDEFGNTIDNFATTGLWQFLNYSGRQVDNIREEPYYGWIPKMDFEGVGNGFHDPAVRFAGIGKDVKQALGLAATDNTLWAVKRGRVSHGCMRLPAGHIWEMRSIFPVENDKMTKIFYFGNMPQDFDLYDIDGSGQPKVMGVQYLISYDLSGTSAIAQREGADLQINSDKKLDFYKNLYGAKQIFTVDQNGKYMFINPHVSMPSYLDFHKKTVAAHLRFNGQYPLYEQAYEQDKIQMYGLSGKMNARNKALVQLMGRIKGCAPSSDANSCGSAAFAQDAKALGQ